MSKTQSQQIRDSKDGLINLLKALSFIQVGYSDLEILLEQLDDKELKEAINEFESSICSLTCLSDNNYDFEFAVQYMHNRIDEILERVGEGVSNED